MGKIPAERSGPKLGTLPPDPINDCKIIVNGTNNKYRPDDNTNHSGHFSDGNH